MQSTGNRLVIPESESGFPEPYLAGPKKLPPDESPGRPDPALQWDRDAHESVFTISLQSYIH